MLSQRKLFWGLKRNTCTLSQIREIYAASMIHIIFECCLHEIENFDVGDNEYKIYFNNIAVDETL